MILADLAAVKGRVALITGGGGHIGRAMAEVLAHNGARVALVDRSENALAEAVADIGILEGALSPVAFVADLEDETARAELLPRIQAEFQTLDILINNAAFVGESTLQGWVTQFESQSLSTWRRALEVNLTAPFHLTQLFTPLLRSSGHGSVINVGSIYGMVGPDLSLYDGTAMGNPAAYAASKGGLLQLTRWLATVLAPDIRVNSISPGGIARGQPDRFVKRYRERTPLGRLGQERDLMGAVAFLAGDMSSWTTGQNIVVDGGWTTW